jgi:methionyl-tRNA formyltransferase
MTKAKTKIVFFGTSDFAVKILEKISANYNLLLVVTTPDKPTGRKRILTPSPVKEKARYLKIPIAQPEKIKKNPAFLNQIAKLKPELIIVAAYGKILPPELINLPEHGCLNVHASLLPKYRGASPIQTAILNGDQTTGITIMLMDLGMDTGDILDQEEINISDEDTFITTTNKLANLGAKLLHESIPPYLADSINLKIQNDDKATYCSKITTEMGQINWAHSAKQINNQIRAIGSTIGAYTTFNKKRLLLLKSSTHNQIKSEETPVGKVQKCPYDNNCIIVKCGKSALKILEVQLEGKKPAKIKEFINGHHDFIGTILK